jgi:DNA polymerase I-like protein with 3'-5' exonuclease and polymerase domains
VAFWAEALKDEIRRVKPKIIVCLGKPPFDFLFPHKLSKRDTAGGFFRCEEFDCLLYPCDDIYQFVKRAELYGRLYLDIQEVARMLQMVQGVSVREPVALDYRVIHNAAELWALVSEWQAIGAPLFSVDCEWHGRNHIDGRLRSIQFSWGPGKAAYIRFMDDQLNYVFDISYLQAGRMMGLWLGRPEIRYVGHHIAADFPWMLTVLGLPVYERAYMDTEFALQCCDEFADLGLDRLSLAYTDLGRYDVELILWKKLSKEFHEDEGYGRIPDSILIPYALKDVDVVIRAVPELLRFLQREGVDKYYFEIFHPFVTDIFTEFAVVGLPMDIARMDELRNLFHSARRLMEEQLRDDIYTEAATLLRERLDVALDATQPGLGAAVFADIENAWLGESNAAKAFDILKADVGVANLQDWSDLFDHYIHARAFNIRSGPDMSRWLFKVKKYTPVKSTGSRNSPLPSMAWEKVMDLPKDKQALFKPAVDRQTLELLAAEHKDQLVFRLLELNAVGNLAKGFLKEAELDENGEVVKEKGLHFWLAQDGRVHGQLSTTETGRPRAWKPNVLNWPSGTREQITMGIRMAIKRGLESRRLAPDDPLVRYLTADVPSVRSCVTAPEGWMFVESDYATAELRALAFQAGDEAFIKLITEPDTDFGLVHPAGDKDPTPVRLSYPATGPIKAENQLTEFFLVEAHKGVVKRKFTEADLLRDEHGVLIHPPADLHWTLAEYVHGKPREMLDKKKDRVAAKRGNFGATYGIMDGTLERQIEQETGEKPEPGTGQRVLDALVESRPVAFAHLKALEDTPVNPGYLRAASGRKRRFALHPMTVRGISDRAMRSSISAQGREARNFYCQGAVADTAARASVWLLRDYKRLGLKARPMVVLYDSIVTLCPVEERDIVAALHQRYMTELNCWCNHGRVWNFPIDTDYNKRWSNKPTTEEEATWATVPALAAA